MSLPIPLLLIPIGLFGVIVYFAVSKNSGLLIRWAAIMALVLIGLSVVVCLCILLAEPGAVVIDGPVIDINPDPKVVPVKAGNPFPLLIFAVIMILFIAFIIYHALKEQYRKKDTEK